MVFRHVIDMGAQGFLPDNFSRVELVQAIRTAALEHANVKPATMPVNGTGVPYDESRTTCVGSELGALSPQERRVMSLIAAGNTNKEIALKLTLSEKTVKNYIANMFTKLEITRRTQAVALYFRAQSSTTDTHAGESSVLPRSSGGMVDTLGL